VVAMDVKELVSPSHTVGSEPGKIAFG